MSPVSRNGELGGAEVKMYPHSNIGMQTYLLAQTNITIALLRWADGPHLIFREEPFRRARCIAMELFRTFV